MCRFLLVHSQKKVRPAKLLQEFAGMCQKSHAPDGDWQGDGWGIAIKNEKLKMKNEKWEVRTSLKPIWEEQGTFQKFRETDMFVVHARSAGFPEHKGVLAYNQPYVKDALAYVFNGMVRGVTLPMKLDGTIGAQKIFSLIVDRMVDKETGLILPYVRRLIRENAKRVEGMNIGIALGDKMYALCDYDNNADYFSLRYYKDEKFAMICSEPIGSYKWQVMKKGEARSI
ncbi:hypothetical protein HY087_00055 [Candidatus Gottesmanbacteria bacterium]|nr:hypothetical protein [Candidatus Gottesmanbacteria bacterium]